MPENIITVVLTIKSFRAWLLLQTCPNIKGVMKAGDPCRCPIALYLRELYPEAQVYPTGVTFPSNRPELVTEFELPPWADEFVRVFDDKFGTTAVSAEQALEVLDIVTSGFDNAILSLA